MPNGLLESFIKYCTEHPQQRFWQALRNWSGWDFIIATNIDPSQLAGERPFDWTGKELQDTFYWDEKDGHKTNLTFGEAHSMVLLAGKKISDFEDYMTGQTCPVLPDGSFGYYRYDVERFIKGRPNLD